MLNKVLLGLTALAAIVPVNAIWPVPQQISTGKDVLFIERTIKITYNGEHVRPKDAPLVRMPKV